MGQILNSHTFRLFKRTSDSPFIEGMGSILDFSTQNERLYNYDENPQEADENSLRSDWLQVGKDLQSVIDEYESTTKETDGD